MAQEERSREMPHSVILEYDDSVQPRDSLFRRIFGG